MLHQKKEKMGPIERRIREKLHLSVTPLEGINLHLLSHEDRAVIITERSTSARATTQRMGDWIYPKCTNNVLFLLRNN